MTIEQRGKELSEYMNKPNQDGAPGVDERSATENGTNRSVSRRTLCLGIGGAVAMLGLGGLSFTRAEAIIRPPGGQDEAHVISACIRCMKCYEACPRKVIKAAHVESGILEMRTPTLDFSNGWCDFCEEENGGIPLCVKSCPTQALKLPMGATAETTIIGKAILHYDLCLAYRMIGCRFCFDACPWDAIVLDENNLPSVKADLCNGCGACESVCVSLKNGSIAVGAKTRAITVEPVSTAGN